MSDAAEVDIRGGGQVLETVDLTKALEDGNITPEQYIRQHALRVGESNIFEFAVIPLISSLWSSLRRSRPKPLEQKEVG